jgi:hypothetical protein
MVHSGNDFALTCRDKIVGKALATDQASVNYQAGNKFKAALIDFNANLFFGAGIQTLLGAGIVFPYFTTFAQGWIGGIVTVDANHKSRFSNWRSTLYFIIVFLLQTISYSLCISAGVKLGVETYRLNKSVSIFKYRLHRQSLVDILWLYLLAVPIFFIASCFEFLSSWN